MATAILNASNYIGAMQLLETWSDHARDGIFGADFEEESCKSTCNESFKCVACLTDAFLATVRDSEKAALASVADLLKPGIATLLGLMIHRLDKPMNLDDWRNMAKMLRAQSENIEEAIGDLPNQPDGVQS